MNFDNGKVISSPLPFVSVPGTLKLENRNWKFGLHAFVLFFPISTFQFQVSSRERLQN
jgi:hypothetical protein